MKYCKYCLTTNLRPNAKFVDGVCIPCVYNNNFLKINTSNQLNKLNKYINELKVNKKNKFDHDCIVGVSGGKDSTRQAHWVRDRLGLRPLLVCVAYPPLQMSITGAANLSNLISMGFDIITATPSPKTAAKLSLQAFKQFGNVCTSTELALFSTVPRLAVDTGIKLIFWGENPALQVGDSAVSGINEFDGNNLRNLNTLSSSPLDWIEAAVAHEYQANHYRYPSSLEFEKNKINLLYLGPAWDDWGSEHNATYAALNGLTLRPNEEHITGDISNASMLDEDFTNINMMIRYFKFGFGRATDIVNEQIRLGKLTRDEGISIVKKYDGVCAEEIIDKYCNYVDISKSIFWQILNDFVNKDLFNINNNGRPSRKFEVGVDYEN